jgi:hypothetical protein
MQPTGTWARPPTLRHTPHYISVIHRLNRPRHPPSNSHHSQPSIRASGACWGTVPCTSIPMHKPLRHLFCILTLVGLNALGFQYGYIGNGFRSAASVAPPSRHQGHIHFFPALLSLYKHDYLLLILTQLNLLEFRTVEIMTVPPVGGLRCNIVYAAIAWNVLIYLLKRMPYIHTIIPLRFKRIYINFSEIG